MINLTLKQLRYFEALAQHAHFGRAAEASSISQPALSMQIKELEETLGAQLFERNARQVKLTRQGEDVALRIREILARVDDLEDLTRAAQGDFVGRLRLGVIPTIAPYLLPAILRALGTAHPGLDLHVRETLTQKLVSELLDGQLDAAILALPISETSLSEMPLLDENFVLIRPKTQSADPVPDQDALRKMRLLLLEEGHCFRDQALSFCNIPSALPRDGLDGSSLSTLVQMVGAGIGVTLIPEMAMGVETRSADVSVARFPAPQPSRRIGLLWRKSSPITGQLQTLGAIVQSAANEVLKTARRA